MRAGVIGGTGRMGMALARHLSKSNEVVIGSRDPARAETAAKGIGGAEGSDYEGTCRRADLVIFAIPYSAIAEAAGLSAALAGKVAVSTINPISRDGSLLKFPLAKGSAAEELAGLLPRAKVATAFNHVSYLFFEREDVVPMDILVATDARVTYEVVAELVKSVPNLRPLYAGPLSEARTIEMMTPMMLNLAKLNGAGSLATRFVSTKDGAR